MSDTRKITRIEARREMPSAGVLAINMRGFRWEEFVSLVGRYHVGADRGVLWEIFNRVTVGRPAGLYAQLAEAWARQPSLDAMLAIASRPPEDMVSAAEQSRFDQLAPGAGPQRNALSALLCHFDGTMPRCIRPVAAAT